jgi:hypothetical protein
MQLKSTEVALENNYQLYTTQDRRRPTSRHLTSPGTNSWSYDDPHLEKK